jgi:glycosyltransferase 2 family protein
VDERSAQLDEQPEADANANIEAQVLEQGASRKGLFTGLAKFAVAGIILYWLFHKGAIQTDKLAAALQHWPTFLAVCAISIFAYWAQGLRWLALLSARGIQLSIWNAFRYLMEGKFFNLIIPGYFSEDFIRGLYAIRTHQHSRPKVIASLLVDRSTGVFTMLLFGGAGLLLRPTMLGDKRLEGLLAVCGVGIACTLLGVALIRILKRPPEFVFRLAERLHLHLTIDKMYAEARFYATNVPLLLLAIAYTLANQALMIWCFYLLGETLGMGNLTAVDFVIFTPCGMLATILPVSPVGLGVGQVAFLSLFRLAGSEQGANLFSLYTLVVLVTSIFGGVFYLSNKRKKS